MMKKCIFAGCFDPFTLGHKEITQKALEVFDEVVIGILNSPTKHAMFSVHDRERMINKVFEGDNRVKVVVYDGLLTDLLKLENTKFLVRGVRNVTDYEYENAHHYAFNDLYPEMITLYIPTSKECLPISSQLVKELIKYDKAFDKYVPAEILPDLKNLIKK